MAGFINIGFGNIVNRDKIVAVVSRMLLRSSEWCSKEKEEKIVIDATQGRRTKQYLSPRKDFWCCRHCSRILSESVFMQKNYRRKR